MKKLLFILVCFAQGLAFAGTYEEIELAVSQRESDKIIELVRRGIEINTVDRSGNTLLIQAIRQDMPKLFDFLLANRARLNSRNQYGETALSIAAFNGNFHYVQRLVEAGAEINYYGWSPLVYAAFNGHTAIVEYLLKHRATIDAPSGSGLTALHIAALNGHLDVVKKLLEFKANPSLVNHYNETPLDMAVKNKHTEIEAILRGVTVKRAAP